MRGKRIYGPRCKPRLRNIPAYAGKTIRLAACHCVRWEHPRVCGENSCYLLSGIASIGTSPRMRGKREWCNQEAVGERNIPAYAGKTCLRFLITAQPPEHPRVCGENNDSLFFGES